MREKSSWQSRSLEVVLGVVTRVSPVVTGEDGRFRRCVVKDVTSLTSFESWQEICCSGPGSEQGEHGLPAKEP